MPSWRGLKFYNDKDVTCFDMANIVSSGFQGNAPYRRLHHMSVWKCVMEWANWFPIVFFPLKILALLVAMFFAIKSHHDAEKKKNEAAADMHPPVQSTEN